MLHLIVAPFVMEVHNLKITASYIALTSSFMVSVLRTPLMFISVLPLSILQGLELLGHYLPQNQKVLSTKSFLNSLGLKKFS